MRLLVVEDNRDIRDLLVELLEEDGFAVDGVGRIGAALGALAAHRYDLMVLDLGLPDGSGLDVLQYLRLRGSALPVVMCSGRPNADLRTNLFDAGADAVLDKPFSCAEWLARVRALLRREPLQSAAAIWDSRSAAAG